MAQELTRLRADAVDLVDTMTAVQCTVLHWSKNYQIPPGERIDRNVADAVACAKRMVVQIERDERLVQYVRCVQCDALPPTERSSAQS